MNKTIELLKGETIKSVKLMGIKKCDDEPYLVLEMESGKIFTFIGGFSDCYSGKSDGEYPTYISVYDGVPKNAKELKSDL